MELTQAPASLSLLHVCSKLTFASVIICFSVFHSIAPNFRSSYREVHVRLGDKNDHSPVFDKEEYHVSVSEAALVNTPITKLKVSKIEINPRSIPDLDFQSCCI